MWWRVKESIPDINTMKPDMKILYWGEETPMHQKVLPQDLPGIMQMKFLIRLDMVFPTLHLNRN